MGFGITSIKYQTQTRGASDLTILQACIGELISVIVELYFDQIYIADDATDNRIIYAPNSSISGRYYNADLVYFEDGEFLNKCQVGDLLLFTDPTGLVAPGPWILLEIINGGLGRFNITFPYEIIKGDPTQLIVNVAPLKSLIYQSGINASGSYNSQIDGSLRKFIADSASALTDVSMSMQALGNKDWQFDSIEMVGQGDDATNYPANAHVRIKITHSFFVSPLYLVGQYDNMRLGVAPDYFKPDNLIKYQAQIDWNKSSSFLDPAKSLTLDPVGQFGWFGTKYNGAKSDYSISSLTLERVSDAEFVNQLEYNEIEVKFTLTSTGANFSATNTVFIFGFNYLPDDPALYQNTSRYASTNFCLDVKKFNPNNVTVNGANYGTNSQVIKTIKGQVLTTTTAQITVRILFGSDRVDILTQEDVAKYAMWIITERTDLDIEVCDKSNLLVQVNEIYVNLTKVDLLSDVTKFIEHPYDVVGNGVDTLELFPVDDAVANSVFALDYTGLEADGILLKACTPSIVISHASEADIILDSSRINLDSFPLIGSLPAIQAIDYNQLRPYKIEDGIRKSISFERDYNADAGSIKCFALNFPFMNRWEYWLQLAGITSIPGSVFDPSVPFNGANNLWDRLANSTGWTLKYRIVFEIIQNGKLFEQDFEHDLTSIYFESNTDWNNCNIKTYDLDTNDQIIVGSKKYAYASKDTKVVCGFEKTVGDVPDLDKVAIVIWAEGFEGGGVTEVTRISSIYDVTSVSAFKSVDTNNKVKITKTGSVFTGEAILNFDKIKNLNKISLYARIYELQDVLDYGRITNDFILRYTNDGQVRLVLS